MTHTISVLVENKFGVLARIAGLFSARGFNISSLAVGETEDPRISRMTIVVRGDDRTLEQIKKQTNKLIDVIKVLDFRKGDFIDRELVLVKVSADDKRCRELLEILKPYSAKVEILGDRSVCVEAAGDSDSIEKLLGLLKGFGILEVVRTGRIAIGRSEIGLKVDGKPEVNE